MAKVTLRKKGPVRISLNSLAKKDKALNADGKPSIEWLTQKAAAEGATAQAALRELVIRKANG